MAEEVGAAFVSLIPSARGFSKLAQRELKQELRGGLPVKIRPEIDRSDITTMLAEGTRVRVPVDVDVDRTQIQSSVSAVTSRDRVLVDADVNATTLIGATRRAVGLAQATRPTIHVDTDVDRPGFLGRLLGRADSDGQALGQRIGGAAIGGIRDTLSAGVSGVLTNPIVSTLGLAIGAVIGGALSSAIAAGVASVLTAGAGLGVIGLGALIAKEHPAVKAAATDLMETVKEVFTVAAQPLIRPFSEALDVLNDAAVELGPQFKEMFAAIAPSIVPLTEGLVGFVREGLPGFTALVAAAEPLLSDLSTSLPLLGQYVGDFFGIVAGAGPEANRFFRDLLILLGAALKALGIGIVVWAKFYGAVRGAISGAINLVRTLGGKIKSAVGGLGSLLYQAGRNVIQGLINGISGMLGRLGDMAGSVAGTIRNYLPFSPAKVGPLSGSGAPYRSGQAIARDLAAGMSAGQPAVRSAGDQLAGAVGTSSARSGAAMASGATLRWADTASGDRLLDALREMIAVTFGGDPDAALASG